jgi:putative membrane protein
VYAPRPVSNLLDLLGHARLLADVALDPPAAAKASAFRADTLLVWLHITGNLIWIGAVVAMGAILTAKSADPKVRGALARHIHWRVAMPAFALSFLAGVIRTSLDLKGYFVQHHWMHGKLLVVLIVIGLHHVLAGRARKMEGGTVQEAGPSGMLTIVFTVGAILAAFFVVLRFPD